MNLVSIASGTVLALGMATAAFSQQIFASDPQTVMTFFFEEGVPAQLTSDGVGDPLIEFRYEGSTMQVYFYDCTENRDCLALQFYAGYNTNAPVPLEALNLFNHDTHRFTRVYRTDDGTARIEMDIATSWDGISHRDFKDLFSLWIDRVHEFEEVIGW